MADTNKCGGIKDQSLKQSCEATYSQCGSASNGSSVSCEEAVSFCASNETWPASFETDKGRFAPKDSGQCFQILNFFRDNGYKLQALPASKAKPPATTPPAPAKPKQAPPKKAPAAAEPAKSETTESTHSTVEKAAATAGDIKSECASSGNPQAQTACEEIVDACAANAAWPLSLETTGGTFKPNDREQCMALASALSSIGYSLGKAESTADKTAPQAPKGADKPSSPNTPGHTTQSQAVDDEKPAHSNGASLVKSFYDINLGLRVTDGEFVTEKRVLHFPGGKGIKLAIEYRIEKLSTGRYLMEYKIHNDGKTVGGEQSIMFSAEDGKINLGFQIKLSDEADYGSIYSASVVEI